VYLLEIFALMEDENFREMWALSEEVVKLGD
jgi:hypothetical protein